LHYLNNAEEDPIDSYRFPK